MALIPAKTSMNANWVLIIVPLSVIVSIPMEVIIVKIVLRSIQMLGHGPVKILTNVHLQVFLSVLIGNVSTLLDHILVDHVETDIKTKITSLAWI